jgi:hypothetical protein
MPGEKTSKSLEINEIINLGYINHNFDVQLVITNFQNQKLHAM